MSELTNIHARSVKELTTPSSPPADSSVFDQVKLVAGNFPPGYAGNEALTVGLVKELAAEGREAELEEVFQKITQEEIRAKKVEDLLSKNKAEKTYVDSELIAQNTKVNNHLSDQTQVVNTALTQLSTVANKYYPTLVAANADIAYLEVNQSVQVGGSGANSGVWYKATVDATSLTKSAYDPLTQAQDYTDNVVNNRTVLNAVVDKGDELAVFTDKNGRKTWLEIAKDGGPTERTKQYIREATSSSTISSDRFGFAIVDKNGRVFSAIEKSGELYPKTVPNTGHVNKTIKILGIGNSFTQDAFSYTPFLLKEMGVTNFEIVMVTYGGGTLEQYWDFASNDSKVLGLAVFKSENDSWQSLGTSTLKEALNYTNFDTITLQQQSSRSCDYTTYQPFLNNVIDYIYSNIDYPTRLGWHSVPASPDNGWSTTYPTSEQFYNAQLQAVENVLRDTPIEYAIPNNTAVQNARGTVLGTLGTRGNMTADGLHLQEGIPALVAAYAVTLKWLEVFNLNKSIFGSRIAPTDLWLSTIGVQGQNGSSVGVTTDNILIAQKCAIAAIKKPFETSNIN